MSNRVVDYAALRTNQALIIAFLLLGFVMNQWLLVAFVAAVMLLGTLAPNAALFKAVYRRVLKPRRLVRPDVRTDNPEPHQFAQGVGGLVLALGTAAFLLNVPLLGWVCAWVVTALAALNLFAGVCVGCLMYYWFNRLGVPGFSHAPLPKSS